ncbi:MAG: site-specific integrase [bacterium]|nr:site-specific integrase [bacterium]
MCNFEDKVKALPKVYQQFFEYLKFEEESPMTSLQSYYYDLTTIFKYLGNNLLLLEKKKLREYFQKLREEQVVKKSTRDKYRSTLNKFYCFATEQELICQNPMPPKSKKTESLDEEPPEPLNQTHLEVIQKIINEAMKAEKVRYENNETTDSAYSKKLREFVGICFLIDLGPRVSNIRKIFVHDLELDERITPYPGCMREEVSFVKAPGNKNSKYGRTSEPLDQATVDLLKEYLEVAKAEIKIGKKPLIDVKCDRTIQLWCNALKDKINNYIQKNEIHCSYVKRVTPHSFRRTIGTIFGKENTAMAQKTLNHQDPRSLMHYFYPSREEKVMFRKNVLKPRPRPETVLS